jgi:hypothetical protein
MKFNKAIKNYLQSIGADQSAFDTDLSKAANDKLVDFMDAVLDDIKNIKAVSSGALIDSFKYFVAQDKQSATLVGNFYWKFIDRGVNGVQNKVGSIYSFKTLSISKAMVDALERWVRSEGLKARDIKQRPFNTQRTKVKLEELSSERQAAVAIAYSLKKNGIKPRPFLKDILDRNKKVFFK